MSNSHYTSSPKTLAIDIGSSSTRAEIYDADLHPVEGTFSQKTYQLQTDFHGKAELDPERLLETVFTCIASSLRTVEAIDAVGVSCFWHSMLGIDQKGRPTTNVLMWADTRAAGAVKRLTRQIDPDHHHQATGTRLHTSYPMAKLRWLRDEHPDMFARAARWVSFPEYLQLQVSGELSVSTSMSSGTGMLNRKTLAWDTDALGAAGISPSFLAPLSDEILRLHDQEQFPQLNGSAWVPPIGDGAANNLGSYAVYPRHPALMVGTTGALRLVTSSPPNLLPSRLWQYRLDRDHALLGGALSEGGGVIAWLMDTLDTPDHTKLEQQIASAEPDGHGLVVLPYLAGERSPNWHSDAVGTIHGLRFDSSPAHIVQATMESIGYSFAAILDDLKIQLVEPVEVIVTGNALRLNQTWVQMIADICQYPMLMPHRTESSLRGAALHAMRQLGREPEIPDVRQDAQRFEPRADRVDVYRKARDRQSDLYRLLVERDD